MSIEENNNSQIDWSCDDVRDLLYLFVCDELDPEEAQAVEAHVEQCDACATALKEHEILQKKLPTGFVERKLFYYSENN